jgi:superfamily II DNA or RNA helicase
MILRSHQFAPVEWLSRRKRGLVVSPAGSGKTVIAAAALAKVLGAKDRQNRTRVGWMANTVEQCNQARLALDLFKSVKDQCDVKIACAAAATDWSDCKLLVVDECFPLGTMVDGLPIEQIKIGDEVSSFDHKATECRKSVVVDVMKREYQGPWLRIATEGGLSFVCTENHPVFTVELGYISAAMCLRLHEGGVSLTVYEMSKLRPGNTAKNRKAKSSAKILRQQVQRRVHEKVIQTAPAYKFDVLSLRESSGWILPNSPHPTGSSASWDSLLLSEMQNRSYKEKKLHNNEEYKYANAGHYFNENDAFKPNAKPDNKSKGGCIIKRENISLSRRKRQKHKAASNVTPEIRPADGGCDYDFRSEGHVQKPSTLLQGRLGRYRIKIGNRSGWENAFDKKVEIFGQEKNGGVERSRVASVEVYKRGSKSRPSWVPFKNMVFNLHVEKNNNYFANGILVHNCHHAAAPGWREQIETCQGARWGFTATPDAEGDDAEDRDAALRELFGEEWFVVDRDEVGSLVSKAKVVLLEASDTGLREVMDAEINRIYFNRLRWWREDPGKLWAMVSWQVCVEMGIVGNGMRNATAEAVAARHQNESVLVLVNQVEHAKEFAARLGAVACYSGMGAKNRRAAMEAFKSGELKCVVATSLADEGLDVPRASVLVLVSGGRSRAKAEQRTGRVLRQFAGKEHATIYDFEDRFFGLMHRHSLARQQVYRNLGYEIITPENNNLLY